MISMVTSKSDTLTILQIVSNLLNSLSDDQYNELLNGNGKLVYKENTKKISRGQEKLQKTDDISYESLGEKIRLCKTREEAFQVIRNEPSLKTKSELIKLAHILEVHIIKRDTREKIEEKIVESVVGSKIRFETIKNINLKE